MKRGGFWIVPLLFITSILFFGGCSCTVEQPDGSGSPGRLTVRAALEQPDGSGSPGRLTVRAAFEEENGTPLSGCTVRFSGRENSADYQADLDGVLTIAGLPSDGELTVTVLDSREETQGSMTLTFSLGSVIDATTSTDGMGHITVRNDTDEVSLLFILEEDDALTCALWLTAK